MPRWRTLAVAVVALGAAVVAGVLWPAPRGGPDRPSSPGPAAPPPAAAPAPFSFQWPEGSVYTYALAFASSGTFGLGGAEGGETSASVSLEGELALRSFGRLGAEGDFVLGVRLARIDRTAWTLAQRAVAPEGSDALAGRELALVVAPDGALRSLNLAPLDPPLLVNVLRQVLGALQVTVSPGRRAWESWEANPVGQVLVAYEVRADEPGRLVVLRRPGRYTSLQASAVLSDVRTDVAGSSEAVLDRAGHLDRLEGLESVSARSAGGGGSLRHETRIAARLLSIARAPPGPDAARRLAGLVATRLGDVTPPPGTGRQLLAQRAGGLTMGGLVRDLRVHGGAETFPDAGRWMWRATGLLRLHPERCRDLVAVFEAPDANRRLRARVLDLLAATGSAEAQEVLRELLDSREARGSDHFGLLVQRLSLVEEPTAETVDYLRAKVERARGEGALPAAHALGAAIGRRSRAGGGAVDEPSAALLRQGLAGAGTAQEKVGWLGTLGNAGLAEDVPLLAGHARDADPAVRAAAAVALRTVQTPESEAALLALAVDGDGTVRERALHTLTSYALAPAHLAELRDAVQAGRLPPREFAMLATLLERNRHQRDAVLPVVDAMLARDMADARLALRLRSLRQELADGR